MTNTLPTTPNPLAGHPVLQMLDVSMSSIVSDYDDLVPEWQWVKHIASHEHVCVNKNQPGQCDPAEMGYLYINSCESRLLDAKQHMLLAIDRATNLPTWHSLMRRPSKIALHFLSKLWQSTHTPRLPSSQTTVSPSQNRQNTGVA
ncbi:TPA: hypothetical protein ACSP1Y_004662 [Aeromonas hydrophila]|uniref:hypothetical protein n=1 Tax=Aeromonas hydrophila TaxID=644 RepID=UPI0038D15A7D